MKKQIAAVLAIAAVLSFAGCGSAEKQTEAEPAVTTTTAAAPAEAPAETTAAEPAAPADEAAAASPEQEETEAKPAETTSGEFDLDAMIASAEAEIPDITVFTGMKDLDLDIGWGKETTTTAAAKKPAETTTTASAAKPAETTTTAAPATPAENIDSLYTVVFAGTKYSLPISGTLPVPAGWTDKTSATRTAASFTNDSYKGCQIDEVRRGGDALNGVFIAVIEAMKSGTAYPEIQMYKGITWGATPEQIKAQYGEPVHTGNYEQYGCNMTSMYYQDSLGDLMILQVSDKYGLALIEFYRQ